MAKMQPNKKYRGCTCGCGETTGGMYAPGHDARHVSRLVAQAKEAHGSTQVTTLWQSAIRQLPTEALRTKFRTAMVRWAKKDHAATIADMQDERWASWARIDRMVAWIDDEFAGIDSTEAAPVAAAMGMSRGQVSASRA